MRVRHLPVWALLFFIPVALMASADLEVSNNDTIALNDTVNASDVTTDNMNVANDLNLEEGAVDGHRRWGRGWGRGWGWGGGWGGYWGGYGWGYPYYGYASYWPWTGWYW